MLQDKNIVIGITGSIAAFKIPLLVRLLKKEGARIKVMMTPAARDFVAPLTLSTLSEHPVLIEPFDPDDGSWNSHVDLGRWADLLVVAPVSANTMAKMATGIADNFFMTVCLSAKCPVMFAPAMDLDMFRHPATQKNIEILQSYGYIMIDPAVGELASGLHGEGRMEEPENILAAIQGHFTGSGTLAGKKAMVTAGPTHEAIDPVRFIGNHSSGLMGFSIAEELASRGAEVTLISGPVNLQAKHPGIKRIDVVSAEEMYKACRRSFTKADITVMSAAVADFRPESPATSKIKKSKATLSIPLEQTKDILAELGKIKKEDQFLIGFALETDDEESFARQKLESKNLDLIILNSLNDKGAGFKSETNKITIFDRSGKIEEFGLKLKSEVAKDIVDKIVDHIK